MRYLYSSIYLLQEPIILKVRRWLRTKGGKMLSTALLGVFSTGFKLPIYWVTKSTRARWRLEAFHYCKKWDIWLDGCYALSRLYSKTSPKSGPSWKHPLDQIGLAFIGLQKRWPWWMKKLHLQAGAPSFCSPWMWAWISLNLRERFNSKWGIERRLLLAISDRLPHRSLWDGWWKNLTKSPFKKSFKTCGLGLKLEDHMINPWSSKRNFQTTMENFYKSCNHMKMYCHMNLAKKSKGMKLKMLLKDLLKLRTKTVTMKTLKILNLYRVEDYEVISEVSVEDQMRSITRSSV